MALTFPLSAATFADRLAIESVTWMLMHQQETSGLGTAEFLVADLGAPYWEADVVCKPMKHTQARQRQALVESLDGLSTFYLYNPLGCYPASDPGGTILARGSATEVGGVSASGNFVTGAYVLEGAATPIADVRSFTRASTARYMNSVGTLAVALADVLRFDFPLAVASGVLLEVATTNLALRSQEFDNATWTKANATVTANASAGPDGTMVADRIVASAVNDVHSWTQAANFTSGLNYTLSIYFRAAGLDEISLLLPTAAFGANVRWRFDISAMTATQVVAGTGDSGTITSIGGGLYRATLTAQATATAAGNYVFYLTSGTNISFLGNGTDGIDVFGAQLEQGPQVTSYIPTDGSTATRAVDALTLYNVGTNTWTVTFDDNTTQQFAGIVGNWAINPALLTRRRVKSYSALRTANPASGSDVEIASLNVNNKELTLDGLPPGYVLTQGDLLAFDYGSSRRALHRVINTVTANGAGVSPSIEVRPHLRPGAVVNADVALAKPAAKMKIVPGSFVAEMASTTTTRLRFRARQTLAAG